jgi:hypothetical protein
MMRSTGYVPPRRPYYGRYAALATAWTVGCRARVTMAAWCMASDFIHAKNERSQLRIVLPLVPPGCHATQAVLP